MNHKTVLKAHQKVSNNLILKGTLILTITGFATRFIGFYNRIFLSNLIGARQLGIYQLIFPLYMVAFSLTTLGNELALTKLVSEYEGRNDHASAKAFFKTCFLINLTLGLLVAIIFYHNADFLSVKILNASSCGSCLKLLSLGIPFMAMKGAIHGYFLGLKRSDVHGTSDFLEQVTKVGGLYLIATFLSSAQSFTASFAVIGIVLGEIMSFLYSAFMLLLEFHSNQAFVKSSNRKSGKPASIHKAAKAASDNNSDISASTYNKVREAQSARPIHRDKILSLFIKNSVPLTTNRFALTLLQSAEAILIPTVLLSYYKDSSLSLETYGIFTGMAFPFIMFPSTITNSLSTMLLPAVSGAQANLNNSYLSRLCERSIRFCLLVGIFAGITFYIFGSTIGTLFFHNKEAGIFLYQLSFLCPLIYLATTLASVLNGLGLATHNLMLTVLSTGIRLGFILLVIPKLGISGYVCGLFASYLFLTFASLKKLSGIVCFELHFVRDLLSPFIFFAASGFLTFVLYDKTFLLVPLQIPYFLLVLVLYTGICFLAYGFVL